VSTEQCAKCGNQTIAGHSLTLDASRRMWRLCCLCTAEFVNELDATPAPQDTQ
jgi:hypothetical protein